MRPVSGSTTSGSWCCQPAWFSEADCGGCARRRPEVHGGLAAVGADLEQRADPSAVDPGFVERETFRVGHEALGCARNIEQSGVHGHGRGG
jgi:hypothetical protein